VLNIAGQILAGGRIVWQVLGAMGSGRDDPEGVSVNFQFHGRPPTARDARRLVEADLVSSGEKWVMVTRRGWRVDLEKMNQRFGLGLIWMTGCATIEPDYDLQQWPFGEKEMKGVLRLVIEKDGLAASNEPFWGEYPDDDLAELVPLLSRRSFDRHCTWLDESDQSAYAVAMVDIDHFKRVNDTYGHPIGDRVLIRVAEVAREVVGRRGLVYRYGGEELSALMPEFTAEEARAVAERIRVAIEAEPWRDVVGLSVTASIGVADRSSGGTAASVVISADKALYACKNNGRNQVRIAGIPD
jgi:diguanylate cyclase (GGDEF)-like protein